MLCSQHSRFLGHGPQHLPYPARVMGHLVAHHPHLSTGRGREAADHIDGRGLAQSVGSQQAKDLSLLDREGEVVNGTECPNDLQSTRNWMVRTAGFPAGRGCGASSLTSSRIDNYSLSVRTQFACFGKNLESMLLKFLYQRS